MHRFYLFVFLSTIVFAYCQKQVTEVVICSTIHGAHQTNPNYSYDDLFAFIENYDPDVIGVEIRNEDIDSSDAYLKRSYPYEMRECMLRYRTKKIYGFDWLGDEIKNKPIPADYFKNLKIKKLAEQLNADTSMQEELAKVDSLAMEKNKMVMNASLQELNDGTYDSLNTLYYTNLALVLDGTPYQQMVDFYQKRDQNISDNISEIIRENRGSKILFLMGADHRSFTLREISNQFSSQIILNKQWNGKANMR